MKVSTYKQEITPVLPCHMEGYNDRIATSVHSPLYAHTLCIQNQQPIVIHVFDVIIITKEFANRIKKDCHEKYGFAEDNVLVTCIHTHSGPLVSNLLTEGLEPDPQYMEILYEAALKATEVCLNQLEEATFEISEVNIDGFFCNRNGKELPYNPMAYLMKFTKVSGESIVDLVHFACHPTILDAKNHALSSDFIGAMRDRYEQLTSRSLIFVNGEGGDTSTRLTRQGSDFHEVERVGNGIADILARCSSFKALTLNDMFTQSYSLMINYAPSEDEWLVENYAKYEHKVATMDKNDSKFKLYHDMYYLSLKKIINKEHITLQPTTTVIEFSDFRIVTIPGELVYEFGRRMRSIDDKPMLILTYTNDFNIYAVNKEQYGKYFESYNTMYPYGKADEMIEATMNIYQK